MKNETVLKFLAKFEGIPPSELITEEIGVIYDLGKYSKGTTEYSRKIADILWEASTNETVPAAVSEEALAKFGDLLKGWEYHIAKDYFERVLTCLRKHQSSYECLKIFEKIVKNVSYFRRAEDRKDDSDEDPSDMILTASYAINRYIEEQDLVTAFFDDMKHYCSKVKGAKFKKDPKKQVFAGKAKHED